MSSQPSDPHPHDPAPERPGRETETPPPGFFASTAALFANRNAKIVAILLIVLGIAMVGSINSTSKGPGPGVVDLPSIVGPLLR